MKIIPYFLPVISFTLPAGIVLYFLVSNLYRIGQQAFITRTMYRDAARQPDPPRRLDRRLVGGQGPAEAQGAPRLAPRDRGRQRPAGRPQRQRRQGRGQEQGRHQGGVPKSRPRRAGPPRRAAAKNAGGTGKGGGQDPGEDDEGPAGHEPDSPEGRRLEALESAPRNAEPADAGGDGSTHRRAAGAEPLPTPPGAEPEPLPGQEEEEIAVEWVEMTGPTLEDAKDLALEHLGVDESDAEFEVLEEPRTGPVRAPPGRGPGAGPGGPPGPADRSRSARAPPPVRVPQRAGLRSESAAATAAAARRGRPLGQTSRRRAGRAGPAAPPSRASRGGPATARSSEPTPAAEAGAEPKGTAVEESVSVEDQAEIMAPFLEGLLEAFGRTATIERAKVDDETIELQVSGDDLGLLIGPKGQTLQAVQDLARTVVQRRAPGHHEGRVRVDVGGYRQRRREALARFATQVADEVRESGESKALEPMGSADRKIVHDTINELDGVRTTSEGEEPSRRVRILPDD